jgi:membrane protease YdiL (CAAX protease family)
MTAGREQNEWGGQEGPDPRGHSATVWEVAAVAFLFVGVVALNALAWAMPAMWMTVVVYHLVFAVGLCVVGVGLALAVVTVTPRLGNIAMPSVGGLATLVPAMCMSTMFEEVFFRGYLQTTVRRGFGVIPALGCSAVAFSIYHVGYGPEWREPSMLVQMTLVGLMFAAAYQLTASVLTSFTLNLPHAIVTFLERGEYFTIEAALMSLLALAIGSGWLAYAGRLQRTPHAES